MDNQINRTMLANFEVSNVEHVQQEIGKITNVGSIRGMENGALHFITVPRDQEFIDHSLLNPEYLAQFPNGFIVDLIPSGDGEQQSQQMITETINADLTFQGDEQDRRLTAALLQLVNKQCHIKFGNETQVIVANKDLAVAEEEKSETINHHFASVSNQQTLQQNLAHNNQFKIFQNQPTNQSQVNPPLPPLTPIRRLTRQRKNSIVTTTQQISPRKEFDIHYLKANELIIEDEIDSRQRPLAKKSLPHKKRITKKLKTIDKIESPPSRQTVIYQDIQPNPVQEDNQFIVTPSNTSLPQFSCQLCGDMCNSQIDFFAHLKSHYEPEPVVISTKVETVEQDIVSNQTDENNVDFLNCSEDESEAVKIEEQSSLELKENDINGTEDSSTHKDVLQIDEVEFSDTEDMLEGIRGVVDKVQESVGNDSNDGNDWYSNSSLNGNITYKTDEHNQNLNTSVENFSIFFKNNLDKNCENQGIILSIDESQQKLDDASDMMDNESYDEANKKIQTELAKILVDNEKLNQKTKPAATRPQRSRKAKTKHIADDDFSDAMSMDGMSSEDDKKLKKRRRKCTQCDKLFNSSNALKYHELSHTGERPHQCEVCGKSFFAQSALKVHMRLHSGDKPYECQFCKRAFRQWGDLKYHTISLHTDERNFQCEFCGKAFARRYSLVIHRRIHTSERNYKCEFCPKTFRASSYLQNHRKVHTGEKPYTCAVCGKKFRVSGDLKRHSNIHGREKKKKGDLKVKDEPQIVQIVMEKPAGQIDDFIEDEVAIPTPMQLVKSEPNILMDLSLLHEELNQANTPLIKIQQQNRTDNSSETGTMIYSDGSVQIFKTEPSIEGQF